MKSSSVHPEPDYPFPPRFWWTKRIVLLAIAILIATAAARIVWGYDASARLRDAVAAVHQRGEVLLIRDLNVPPVADEQNAVWYLTQAATALNPNAEPPSSSALMFSNYLPLPKEWHALSEKAHAGNQPSMRHARQARQHRSFDWKIEYKSPGIQILLPMLNEQRGLANLLGDMAVYLHLQGNDQEAIELIFDLLHQRDALDQQPFLVSRLVSVGIEALAMTRLELIAPELRIEDDATHSPATQPASPATRRQLRELIARLVDAERDRRMSWPLVGERAMVFDATDIAARNSILLRPMYQLDQVHVTQAFDAHFAAATQPTWPLARQALAPPRALGPTTTAQLPRTVSTIFSAALNRFFETEYRHRTERAMAAISVAVRLYRADHDGAYPPNLEALVPAYLPHVPIDGLSPTGTPIQYRMHNGDRPIIYNVGPDGANDLAAGNIPVLPPAPQYGWSNQLDQIRDLSRFDPPPPPTQPIMEDYTEPQDR